MRLFLLVTGAVFGLLAGTAGAATIVVTNLDDSGEGSLRAAIEAADGDGGPTTITFDPSLAGGTITLLSPLPELPMDTTIDGDLDADCDPDIALLGGGMFENGLSVRSPGCTVRGLAINGFGYDAINVGNWGGPETATVIECCHLGVQLDGVTLHPNGGSGVSFGTWAGGSRVGPGNVIAGNSGVGVYVAEGFDQDHYPDFTGLSPDATLRFSVTDFPDTCGPFASADGITPTDGGGHPFIDNFGLRLTGTVAVSEAGDYTFTITQVDDWARLVIDGGVQLDLTCCDGDAAVVALTEGDHSIELDFLEAGGTARVALEIAGPGTATLSTGGQPGLLGELFQLRLPVEGVTITENSIFDNLGLGIDLECGCGPANDDGDLDLGPNGCLNSPEFDDATPLGGRDFQLAGSATPGATVEVFATAGDPSGTGEGKTWLTSAVAGPTGAFTAVVTLPNGFYGVTATSTDDAGSTSEFSRNFGLLAHEITVTSSADSGAGTLRDALEQSLADGTDTVIRFDPSLTGATIELQSPLPPVSDDGTTIDGDVDADCWPDIELDGSLVDGSGLRVTSSDNAIRGLVVNRFAYSGILIQPDLGTASGGNAVTCCFIGTDRFGTSAEPNGRTNEYSEGIHVDSSAGNVIGGDRTIARNLISGNNSTGVRLSGTGAIGNVVAGNLVGTDVSGTFAIPNSYSGIDLGGAKGNTVGGNRTTHGNLVSGNTVGIKLCGSSNTVAGNLVGTDITGTVAIPNTGEGITIGEGADDNLIGGVAATEGNVVAAGTKHGILILGEGTDGNRVEGNLIGTDITGTQPMGNAQEGVAVYGGVGNIIGSTDPAKRNVICSNGWAGVNVWFDFTVGTQIIGNWIGVGADGVMPLGNGKGIGLWLESSGTVVGGPGGAANRIAYNTSNGVEVLIQGGVNNRISRNSIHDNGALGIDIGPDGVNANDPGDGDDGPNRLVNAPELASAVTQCGGGATTVSGAVDTSNPDTGVIELFGSPVADPSGHGEGKTFLAQTLPAFNGTFTIAVPVQPVGSVITATYTDADGNTSEFSNAVVVQTTPLAPSGLQATAVAGPSVDLSWVDNASDETGFRIERRAAGDPDFAFLANVTANTTSYHDASGLLPATAYYYRVRAEGSCQSLWSNVAVVTSPAGAAARTCVTQVSPMHDGARWPSVAHNGTQWAAAWVDRAATGEQRVYFQLLNQATGAPVGTPVAVSDGTMLAQYPTLRWNGSHFGVIWSQSVRGPAGEAISDTRFALLSASGEKVRGDIRFGLPSGYANDSYEDPLVWDGGSWAFIELEDFGGTSDLVYYRLDADGDLLVGPVKLTDTPTVWDFDVSMAWNGAEHGLAWVRQPDNETYEVYFQRLQPDGTLLGTPTLLWTNPSGLGALTTSVVWNGAGWAVAWMDIAADGSEAIYMRLLDAAGSPTGPATRVSSDFDPDSPPEEEWPVYDELPVLVNRLGGGYVIFTSSYLNTTDAYEIGRLEADSGGNRVGTRAIVSDNDGKNSVYSRLAGAGSDFLIAYNDGRLDTVEVASVLVDAAGVVTSGPHDLTSGHMAGNATTMPAPSNPLALTLGEGFAALWLDPIGGANRIYATIFDGTGTPVAQRTPLTDRSVRARPGAVAVGDTFALAWKDGTNAVVFDRYDELGNSLLGEVTVATGAAGRPNVALAFSGEAYGLAWFQREGPSQNLKFQRVAPDGTLVGTMATVSSTGVPWGTGPLLQWVGTGWALLFGYDNDLFYALLDPTGAVVVPPVQLTSTASRENAAQMVWNGSVLGLAWAENLGVWPPANDIYFTALGLDGTLAFSPEIVVGSDYGDANPSLYWDGDSFRLVHVSWPPALREIAILADGTVLPGERMLSNRGGVNAVAFNGATLGIVWQQFSEMYFETSACLDDVTPPPCPALTADFDGETVSLSWTASGDPESGVRRFYVYRDGEILADLAATTTAYQDSGLVGTGAHSYEVRAYNGAYLESSGCATWSTVGVTVSSTGDLVTTEAGGTAACTLVLNSQPAADVTIPLSSSDLTEGTVSPASLTFTPENWDTPQDVTITGVDDALDDGDVVFYLVTGTASSADPAYDGLDPADRAVTNLDDDVHADLAVSMLDSPDPVSVGGTLTYTVTITNLGPSAGTGVAMADTLPAGVAFVSAVPSQGSCGAVGSTVICTIGTIGAGGTATVTITVTPQAAGGLSNTAAATTTDTDPVPSNNSATAGTTVVEGMPCGVVIQDQTFSTTVTVESCDTLTAGPNVTIVSPGDVTFRAAQAVILRNGFSVGPGGHLTVALDPSLAPPP